MERTIPSHNSYANKSTWLKLICFLFFHNFSFTTKKTLEDAKAKLEAYQNTKDAAAINGLTKHDLTGAMLQAGVQSYFALNDTQDLIAQKQAGMVQYPYLSYGTFSNSLTTRYRYGLPFSTAPSGVTMDIDRILHTKVDKDNSREKQTAFNRSIGPRYSANEHLVPEQLFDDPNTTQKEANGISAVKALQIAASEGQTIYTITKDNQAEAIPKLNHSDYVMTDIKNAMAAGKEVTISEKEVSFFGWNGAGYTVIDPETGVGGYLIEGGKNGGVTFLDLLQDAIDGLFSLLSIIGGIVLDGVAAIKASIIGAINELVRSAIKLFQKCDPIIAMIILIPLIQLLALFIVLGTIVGVVGGLILAAAGSYASSFYLRKVGDIECT